MIENQTNIKTVKKIYPQIYAYILPDDIKKQGWIKIGYTTRKDVEKRIREQTNTAAGKLHYKTLWAEPALFINPEPKRERWFTDKTLHDYLRRFKNRKQWEYLNKAEQKEWFYYNGAPQKAHDDFEEFVQEFLRKRQELANYFDENIKEDIFDYIPPQQTNQIYTPKKVVKTMVDKLEEEDPNIFKNPDKTFADLYMKSGLYITEIVQRLYQGLEATIPEDQKRLKHILENQVYGFAPTQIIYQIAKRFIFGFDENINNINQSHIVYLDTSPYAKNETKMTLEEKCDEIFGGR